MAINGKNTGRIGEMYHIEKHIGGHNIIHVKDERGHTFSTRLSNVFAIGENTNEPWVSIPAGRGIKLSIMEEREIRLSEKNKDNEDDEKEEESDFEESD